MLNHAQSPYKCVCCVLKCVQAARLRVYNLVQKELRHCLLKWIFRSRTSLFSFATPPHFIVAAAAKSIEQSNILNIEKGEAMGFIVISLKTRGKV